MADFMRYVVVIDGEPGAYGLWVPDMPGCTAMADTVDGLLVHAQGALREWTESQVDMGNPVPAARGVEDVREDDDVKEALAEGAMLAAVPLIRSEGLKRVNVSFDGGVLRAIDAAGRAAGLDRSKYLAIAAQEKIAREA